MTATDYLCMGLSLVPLHPASKRPLGNDWQHRPVTNAKDAQRLEGQGVGLHHEASGTVALDIDHAEHTARALTQLGIDLKSLLSLPGPKIQTPSGVKPLYRLPEGYGAAIHQLKFVNPKDRRENLSIFELRAKGQDVLPPSLHPSGVPYAWLEPPESREAIPLLPDCLRGLYSAWAECKASMEEVSPWYVPPKLYPSKSAKPHANVIEHYNTAVTVETLLERHHYQAIGGRYLAPSSQTRMPGVSLLDGKVYSHHASDTLNDGYAHDAFDCLRLLEAGGDLKAALDLARAELGLPAFKPEKDKAKPVKTQGTARTPKLVFMDTVEAEEVDFLWYPYIPLGKLTMLEGDPGLGKTFMCLSLSAVVTRGHPWPGWDGERLVFAPSSLPPSNVIYLTAEDGLADTLKPRLEAAQADCSRVAVLQGYTEVYGGEEVQRAITLKDVDVLEQALEQTQAKLVVIDPIQGYLGANTDMHRANEVRPILARLGELAEKFNCAVLGIRHLNKSNKGSALHRGLGSVDFTAFARSQLIVGKDGNQRVLAHVKSSLAEPGSSLVFDIQDGKLEWLGGTEATAEDVAFSPAYKEKGTGEDNKLEEAKAFLALLLDESPKLARIVAAEAGQEGITKATLKRAKDTMDIRSTRIQPSGSERGKGEWYWHYAHQVVSLSEDGDLIVQNRAEIEQRYEDKE